MIERDLNTSIPPLVEQAVALAKRMGFEQSCRPEIGRLLHLLAAQVREGAIGEIGTGCGVGTAWMASGLAPEVPEVRLVTVELNEERASAAETLFRAVPRITTLRGDWSTLAEHGPFKLLFADGGRAKERDAEAVLQMLEIGGTLLLDDLTPEELWPEEWQGKPDPVREFWLKDPRLVATEIYTTSNTAAIIAVRVVPEATKFPE